jgi:membrane carboxypeptidase/penicillin-binding protein PbpC
MKIIEVIAAPIAAPQKQEPLILTPDQQSAAVAQARKRKLKNLIAQRQAQDRNAAATAVSKQDVETAFVLNSHGMLG